MELAVAQNQSRDSTKPLQFLWLELTQKCNLACNHCYVSSSPKIALHDKMRHEDWVRVIEEAAALGCKSIQFIGGEPLLYPKIEELIELCVSSEFEFIEIYTNATPLTREKIDWLQARGVHIATSVYSDDPGIHDKVTNKAGSFQRTIDALKAIDQGRSSVRVGYIEMEENAGNFAATKRMLNEIGVRSVGFDRVRGFGRGENYAPDAANCGQSAESYDGLCGQCSKGRLCVTNSGAVFPCIMSREFLLGNALQSSIEEIALGQSLADFRIGMTDYFELKYGKSCAPRELGTLSTPCQPDVACPPDGACMVCGPGICNPDVDPCVPDADCTPQICFPSPG